MKNSTDTIGNRTRDLPAPCLQYVSLNKFYCIRRLSLRIVLGKSVSETTNGSILNGPITNKDIIPSVLVADSVHSSCALQCEI